MTDSLSIDAMHDDTEPELAGLARIVNDGSLPDAHRRAAKLAYDRLDDLDRKTVGEVVEPDWLDKFDGDKPVCTDRELIDLLGALLKAQVREGRINSIEELHGMLRHIGRSQRAAPSPARETAEAIKALCDQADHVVVGYGARKPDISGAVHRLAEAVCVVRAALGAQP